LSANIWLNVQTPFQADPSRIPDDQWEYEGQSSDGLRVHYIHWVDRERGIFFRKTENLAEPAMLEENRQLLDDSQSKRFGDGKVVGRIPLNVFYRDFASRLKEGDEDFMKWWLNNGDNRPYRTFRGRV
jgi:hypothetical protein